MKYSFDFYAEKRLRYKVEGIGQEIIDGILLDVYKDRPRTLPEILRRSVDRDPKHEALVYGDRRISYGELAQMVDSLAFRLKEDYGVEKRDRVMLLLRNTPEFVVSFLAASQIGAISVPTNTRLKAPEIEYILKDSEPSILFMEPELWGRVAQVKERGKNLQAILFPVRNAFQGLSFSPTSSGNLPRRNWGCRPRKRMSTAPCTLRGLQACPKEPCSVTATLSPIQ